MDDKTDSGPSEAQISAAQDRIKALRAQLDVLPSRGEGDPARKKITDQIIEHTKVAHAEPPVRWSADGPSDEQRAGARARLAEVNQELVASTTGSRRHTELLNEKIELVDIVNALGARPLSGLPWDVRQAELRPEPPASRPAELAEIPPLGGHEQWRLDALKEVLEVAEKAGHGTRVPTWLAIVSRHHREGTRWSEEKALDHWRRARGYTPEAVEQITAAANALTRDVLGPKFRAQLAYLDQLYNPELIEAALRCWGRWPFGAER